MDFALILVLILYLSSSAGYIAFFINQKKGYNEFGFYTISAGFACHVGAIVYNYFSSDIMPVQNLYETLSIAACGISGVFILLRLKFRLKILGAFAAPFAFLIMLIVVAFPIVPETSRAEFDSYWVLTHVIAILTGEAAFALACFAGIMYLLQEHAIKSKKRGFFYKRLPSLDLIDNTGYTCIMVGFILLTLGLILGIVYAKQINGNFWSWTPKEICSGFTWVLYAILLHGRLSTGWHGKRAAVMAIIGFVALLFTFFGVDMYAASHHGDSLIPEIRKIQGSNLRNPVIAQEHLNS